MTIDMKLIFVQLVIVCFLFACKSENTVEITVLKDTVSHNYLGNGVEWDPYDEAESWGHSVSEDDWNKLFKRLDFMKPQYVRCMINSPYRYFISKDGSFDKTRNINSISRLLRSPSLPSTPRKVPSGHGTKSSVLYLHSPGVRLKV